MATDYGEEKKKNLAKESKTHTPLDSKGLLKSDSVHIRYLSDFLMKVRQK